MNIRRINWRHFRNRKAMNITFCLQRAAELQAASDSANLDVELLLAHVLEKDRAYLFTWPEKNLSADQCAKFEKLLARRVTGEPIAYILGLWEFWSLPLRVNSSTLIPRPDTELLVELALARLPKTSAQILDLGTGTGAIALALASENSVWAIQALDFSADACELAESNRQQLNLPNVRVRQSHWFSVFDAAPEQTQFDLIVSNPPYIDKNDRHLTEGDLRFEPLSALVAESAGLADFQHIATAAPAYLTAAGWLLFEHGCDQAAAVQAILIQAGFSHVQTQQDLNGLDRVTLGRLNQELQR